MSHVHETIVFPAARSRQTFSNIPEKPLVMWRYGDGITLWRNHGSYDMNTGDIPIIDIKYKNVLSLRVGLPVRMTRGAAGLENLILKTQLGASHNRGVWVTAGARKMVVFRDKSPRAALLKPDFTEPTATTP